MKQAFKDMFASKKFLVAITAVLVSVGAKVGLNVGNDVLLPVVVLVASYIVGQGIADAGKEKAKIEGE
ncbi:MAG: hypothetical protein HRU44_03105 [Candidatus Thalassarchaeum sp.]|nr:hypothetical protein [Candidatus Thalassarchaeum sp.]